MTAARIIRKSSKIPGILRFMKILEPELSIEPRLWRHDMIYDALHHRLMLPTPDPVADLTTRVEVLENLPFVYGLDYNPGIGTAANACARVELAADGKTRKTVKSFVAMPVHDANKGCVVSDCAQQTVNYYLNPSDWGKRADGSASVLTGADGDVMMHLPIAYWRIDHYNDNVGNVHPVYLLSDKEFSGSEPHPAFYVSPGGTTLRDQFIGAYKGVLCDAAGKPLKTDQTAATPAPYTAGYRLRSLSGAKPATNLTS